MKRILLAFAVAAVLAGCSKSADTNTATTDQSTSATATSDASGAPFVAIDIPVYPGAKKDADKSMAMQSNGSSVKIDSYSSKDDSETVAAWYKFHLPAAWSNLMISSGRKTAVTFSTPDHGNDTQSVIVTGEDSGDSRIQISTKTGP